MIFDCIPDWEKGPLKRTFWRFEYWCCMLLITVTKFSCSDNGIMITSESIFILSRYSWKYLGEKSNKVYKKLKWFIINNTPPPHRESKSGEMFKIDEYGLNGCSRCIFLNFSVLLIFFKIKNQESIVKSSLSSSSAVQVGLRISKIQLAPLMS